MRARAGRNLGNSARQHPLSQNFITIYTTTPNVMPMSMKEAYCTPPSSDVEPEHTLPPSPPASPKPRSAVDSLIGLLRLRKAGRSIPNTDWKTFTLSDTEYADIEQRVASDESFWSWYQAKARWDWDSSEYILRMPTAVHERFIAKVEDAIVAGIDGLAGRLAERHDEETAAALRAIYKGRSATLDLCAPKLENSSQSSQSTTGDIVVHRSPDATFFHPHATLPPLVVEVSYSQQRKDLPRLAESYVVDSQHQIRCVLGLDITYASNKGAKKDAKRDKTASLSVWRPGTEKDEEDGEDVGICRCDTEDVTFRNVDGQACDGALHLSVADLLPTTILESPDSAAAQTITITYAQLASFLEEAETAPTQPQSHSAPRKFRKRKRSPPERLSEEREASYLDLEAAEVGKERDRDAEWKGSGWEPIQLGAEAEVELRRSKRNKTGRGVDGG